MKCQNGDGEKVNKLIINQINMAHDITTYFPELDLNNPGDIFVDDENEWIKRNYLLDQPNNLSVEILAIQFD